MGNSIVAGLSAKSGNGQLSSKEQAALDQKMAAMDKKIQAKLNGQSGSTDPVIQMQSKNGVLVPQGSNAVEIFDWYKENGLLDDMDDQQYHKLALAANAYEDEQLARIKASMDHSQALKLDLKRKQYSVDASAYRLAELTHEMKYYALGGHNGVFDQYGEDQKVSLIPWRPEPPQLSPLEKFGNVGAGPWADRYVPNRVKTPLNKWLYDTDGFAAEVYGAQSLPGTFAAITSSTIEFPRGSYGGKFSFGALAVGEEILKDGRFVFDTKTGMLDMVQTSNMSTRMQITSAGLAAVKTAPFFSLVGTSLEYGLYAYDGDYAGMYSEGKLPTVANFAADASLDLAKSVVAGAVGGAASAYSAAFVGAAVGSAFPVVGTAAGFTFGLIFGAATSWAIEQGYNYSDSRNSFKRWLNN